MFFSSFFIICTKLKNVDISRDRVQKPYLRGPLAQSNECPRRARTEAEGPWGIKGAQTMSAEEQETLYHALGPMARRIP